MEPINYDLLLIAAQTATAFVLAAVFFGYYRLYHRLYLGAWSASFLLLALYALLSTSASWLSTDYPASHPSRLLLTALSLFAAYLQVVFLLLGVATFGRDLSANRAALAWASGIVAVLAVGLTLAFAFDLEAAAARNFWRVQLRYLVVGMAFLCAAIWLLWSRRRQRWRLGRILLSIGFAAYAAYAGALLAAAWSSMAMPGSLWVLASRGLVELVIYFTIGMGLVMWLLERERERSSQAQQRADYLDQHDALTGLPNRQSLLVFLERQRWSEPYPVVLYLIGIDRFRMLNESLGLHGGDQILRDCAECLQQNSKRNLMLARIAGDIFAVVRRYRPLQPTSVETEASGLMQRLSLVAGRRGELPLTVSVGIANSEQAQGDAEAMLGSAQAALAAAKDSGPSSLAQWQPGMKSSRDRRLTMELKMRRLLDSNQLELYFQPIVDLKSRKLMSAEALVRWVHPKQGVLGPAEFLPAMQDAGLMERLDERVLELALEHQAGRLAAAAPTIPLSVNLTADQFQRDGLAESLSQLLRSHQVESRYLQLEVTETNAMVDIPTACQVIEEVRAMGIMVSIDDFGTGYSSLAYLAELPVDRIKIDRAFVNGLGQAGKDSKFVQGIVSMIHTIGAKAVAEGVETEAQELALRRYGCDFGQGFLYGRPLSARRFAGLLEVAKLG
jgi:diguanylate cyclase (GGDEF)-like protein